MDVSDYRQRVLAELDAQAQQQTSFRDLVRRAVDVLEQSGFLLIGGGVRRPDYLEALRTVVDDPDPEVRRRAIGVLARQKDEYAQRRLIEGLRDPSKALIPPAKAIQYLGYDV